LELEVLKLELELKKNAARKARDAHRRHLELELDRAKQEYEDRHLQFASGPRWIDG
jgi:hypothetical protein